MSSENFRLLRIEKQLIHSLKHSAREMSSENSRLLRIEKQLIHSLKHSTRGDE
ncbi:MAG: hypothetical protein SWX82_12025 [Cyanobacteriota bacterium]|nr:hypothetical protein [Cyanobacteriota bacterium]